MRGGAQFGSACAAAVRWRSSAARLQATKSFPIVVLDSPTVSALDRRPNWSAGAGLDRHQSAIFLGLNAHRLTSQMIRLFLGLSVASGIASVLMVSVVQRSRKIGILRATGGARGQIMRVFLIQGAVVGLLGTVIGSAMASALLVAWRLAAKNPDGTPLFLITIAPSIFMLSAALATLTALVAAVTLALCAARLERVEAIRV